VGRAEVHEGAGVAQIVTAFIVPRAHFPRIPSGFRTVSARCARCRAVLTAPPHQARGFTLPSAQPENTQPPDLLLGALLKIASDLSNSSVELRRQLAFLGHKKLDERGAEKRAFNSWLRANDLHNLTLSSEQIARIVDALGSLAPSDRSALVLALNAALDGAR
jgi:hypothetical protein